MHLEKLEFEILTSLIKGRVSTDELASTLNQPMDVLEHAYRILTEKGLLSSASVTDEGFAALEPYKVKRAVFFAAGFGSRLIPITFNTPKPLVRVQGTRIIDTLLDAVVSAGISDITIVRGYLGEQFDQLLYKYPHIKFIDNPEYNVTNNISSAVKARHLFSNAYIFESDLLLKNPALVTPYQYTSNYLGVPVEKTDDWCLFTNRKGRIVRIAVGGRNCHHLFGLSYWNEEDGRRLEKHMKQAYEMPGGKERYWDLVPLDIFIDDYDIRIRECSFDDIIEIDTFKELCEIDPLYKV